MKKCLICEQPAVARGYCRHHYRIARRNGDIKLKQTHHYHGYSYRPEYQSWNNAIRRCTEPDNKNYSDYGGRGITVCKGIQENFMVFIDTVGDKPGVDYSIDRINVDYGYWCGSCAECTSLGREKNLRWADKYQQANNKRIYKNNTSGSVGVTRTYNGKWVARIYNKGKRIVVGTYDTLDEASLARQKALDELE